MQESVEEIVAALRNANQNASSLLVDASSPLCGTASKMFAETEVHTGCAALSAPGAEQSKSHLSSERLRIFSEFAQIVVHKFEQANAETTDLDKSRHTERILANSLLGREYRIGLAGYKTRLEIPWIYLAAKDGTIAVFPASNVIETIQTGSRPGFQASARPWFRAAFEDEPSLQYGLGDGRILTSPYSDALAKPMLVRTYLYRFQLSNGSEDSNFAIGIDLHWPNDASPQEHMPQIARALFGLSQLTPTQKLLSALLLAFGLLALISVMTFDIDRVYTFVRVDEVYGRVSPTVTKELKNKVGESRTASLSFKHTKFFEAEYEKSRQTVDQRENTIVIEKKLGDHWGLELWDLTRINTISWQFLWIKYEVTFKVLVGRALLTYSHGIVPRGEWLRFNRSEFPEQKLDGARDSLRRALECQAVSAREGRFELQKNAWSPARPESEPFFARYVSPAVSNRDEFSSIQYGRAYLDLSDDRIDKLYEDAQVWAVILPAYLESLLESGNTRFLRHGDTVERIVCFSDDKAVLSLSPRARQAYEELLNAYAVPSRSLKRVNSAFGGIGETGLERIYDFAIINGSDPEQSLVVVAQTAMATIGIDPAGSGMRPRSYRIRGYLSWRPADRAFFREMWIDLSGQARNMSLTDCGQALTEEAEEEPAVRKPPLHDHQDKNIRRQA